MTGWSARESHQTQMLLFEAFANLMAHAQATRASLDARLVPTSGTDSEIIEIELRDNGRGFDAEAKFAGKGLTNMHTRAAALGGTLTVRSQPGETRLRLCLPVPAATAAGK
jgi:signal transduction histidine kinase